MKKYLWRVEYVVGKSLCHTKSNLVITDERSAGQAETIFMKGIDGERDFNYIRSFEYVDEVFS